jgi:hypothetical protein
MSEPIRINEKYVPFFESKARYQLIKGGRGGAKSHHAGLKMIFGVMGIDPATFTKSNSHFRGVISRDTMENIRDGQYAEIIDLIKLYGLEDRIVIGKSPYSFYCPSTGFNIIAKATRQSTKTATAKTKGIKDPTMIWIDELPDMEFNHFRQLAMSARKEGSDCQIICTHNTNIDPDHWVRQYLYDKPIEDAYYLHTTYLDNTQNLSESAIKDYERLAELNPELYAVDVLGQWGAKQITRPFAVQYNPDKHRKPCQFQSGRTIYISFDFNLDPFAVVFAHIWRDKDGLHFHVFDEFTIQGGTLPTAITDIKTKYGQWAHLFHITGDYSGTAKQMSMPDKANHYQQIMRSLLLRDRQFELRPNPLHRNSHDHCNFILSHAQDFRIDPSCVNTERDLRTVEINSDQSIIKSDRKSDAQRADHLDAFRYLCNIKEFHEWRKSVR